MKYQNLKRYNNRFPYLIKCITGTRLAVLLLCFMSCNKLIDISPQNSITFKNGLKSEMDIESALAGAGQILRNIATYNTDAQKFKGTIFDQSDHAYVSRQLSPLSRDESDWQYNYLLIAQSNVIINFIGNIDMPEDRKNYYVGQAMFYKAFSYYDLVRQYGDCILMKDEVEIDPMPKSPWSEVVEYAIGLAAEAAELLPDLDKAKDSKGASPKYRSSPCKGSAHALLAHLCAWKAGGKYFSVGDAYDPAPYWEKAEKACGEIIKSAIYQLAANPEEVCTSVLVGDSKESIFETTFKGFWNEIPMYNRRSEFTLAKLYQYWPVKPNSSPAATSNMHMRFFSGTINNMYPANDLRKHAYFYKFEEMSKPENLPVSKGFVYPYKWRNIYVETVGQNSGAFINYDVNCIWWRLADIILLRAECRSRMGNTGGAIEDLNTVRRRANADLYDPSEYNGDLRLAIFKEREKELLFEGHRYFDVIRNEYYKTQLEGGFRTASIQDYKDGAFFISIRQSEFTGNPLLRQNKYWAQFK